MEGYVRKRSHARTQSKKQPGLDVEAQPNLRNRKQQPPTKLVKIMNSVRPQVRIREPSRGFHSKMPFWGFRDHPYAIYSMSRVRERAKKLRPGGLRCD
jgi:hypothetical protein